MARLIALLMLVLPSLSLAHEMGEEPGGLVSGLLHPLVGMDHLLAALAIGLWAGSLAGRKAWILPLAFSLATLTSAALGPGIAPFAVAEMALAMSVLVLGLMAAVQSPPRLAAGILMAASVGLLHGHAHGTEGMGLSLQAGYLAGLATSTWGLHAVGLLVTRRIPLMGMRLLGGSIALAGASLALAL